jgi:hypothetical protein
MAPCAIYSPTADFVAPLDRQRLSLLDSLLCLLNHDIILPRLRRLFRPKTRGWTLF